MSSCQCHTLMMQLKFKLLRINTKFDSIWYLGQMTLSLVNINMYVQGFLSIMAFIATNMQSFPIPLALHTSNQVEVPSSLFSYPPPSISMLDSNYYLFWITLTKFPTHPLVDGGPICRGYLCFHPMIMSRNFANRAPCRGFVKQSAIICSVLQYTIEIFSPFNPVLSKEITYMGMSRITSAQLPTIFIHIYCTLIIPEQNVLLNVIPLCSHEWKKSKCCMVGNYLPYNIWICLFMISQGYEIKHKNSFQDNQSAINMDKNRKKSCTGNYRYIDICYFFAKGRSERNKMSI